MDIPTTRVSPDGPFALKRGHFYIFSAVVFDSTFKDRWNGEGWEYGSDVYHWGVSHDYTFDFMRQMGWSSGADGIAYYWLSQHPPSDGAGAWPREDPGAVDWTKAALLQGQGFWTGPDTTVERLPFAGGMLNFIGVWEVEPRGLDAPIIPTKVPGPAPLPPPEPSPKPKGFAPQLFAQPEPSTHEPLIVDRPLKAPASPLLWFAVGAAGVGAAWWAWKKFRIAIPVAPARMRR